MERSIRYDIFIDLENIQHKLSSDYSTSICFSRDFPDIGSITFSVHTFTKCPILKGRLKMQFFS